MKKWSNEKNISNEKCRFRYEHSDNSEGNLYLQTHLYSRIVFGALQSSRFHIAHNTLYYMLLKTTVSLTPTTMLARRKTYSLH